MKKTLCAMSLFIATNALAVRIEVPKATPPAPVETARKAAKLKEARAVFSLPDGSIWITHPAPAKREPNALAVTRFESDGSAMVFLVSDWLPKGSIPRGWCGQVYGVTQLDDGRIAVSGGWTDGRQSHNAVFVLRRRDDGRYDTDRVVELPGVGEIAATRENGIVALTDDPTRRDHGPMLMVIDPDGKPLALYHGNKTEGLTAVQAARNTANAKLRRVDENGFAYYNPAAEEVYIFNLEVGRGEATTSGRNGVFVGDDAELSGLRVVGMEVMDDGDLVIARTGRFRGRIGTHLTVYDGSRVKETAFLDRPWNHVIRDKGKLHGVVNRGAIALDTVTLVREK